jgi:tetratricopeptide (TPR) repeat protein
VTANIFFITPYLMAERFAYTPSAGFCLAAASLIVAVTSRIGDPGRRRRAVAATFAAAIALLGGRTLARNADFKNHIQLWETETKSSPDNTRAWLFLSGAYQLEERWGDAEHALLAAARIDPALTEAWVGLGDLYLRQGRAEEARAAFDRSLNTAFTSMEALQGYVRSSLLLGDSRDALMMLTRFRETYRGQGGYWHLTGLAREAAGDREGALGAYREAARENLAHSSEVGDDKRGP